MEGQDASPILYVNGKRHVMPQGKAEQTLLAYLRGLGLNGTKLGCGEGGCGAIPNDSETRSTNKISVSP